MARDGYVTLGTLLTPEEAGMAQGLLASEGIDALLEDQALSAVDPLVRFAIGGTKLLVPQGDAERSVVLLDAAGVLAPASDRPTEDVEIPEAEWSAPPPQAPPRDAGEPRWPGIRVVLLFIVLVVAALAVLGESSRPQWPPWRR
jgi:hypothetical protein